MRVLPPPAGGELIATGSGIFGNSIGGGCNWVIGEEEEEEFVFETLPNIGCANVGNLF